MITCPNDWGTLPHPATDTDWLLFRGVNHKNSFKASTLSTHQILRPPSARQMPGASKPHHQGSVHPAWRKVRSRLQRTTDIKEKNCPIFQTLMKTQGPFVLSHSNETFTRDNGSEQAMINFLHFFKLFNRAFALSGSKIKLKNINPNNNISRGKSSSSGERTFVKSWQPRLMPSLGPRAVVLEAALGKGNQRTNKIFGGV